MLEPYSEILVAKPERNLLWLKVDYPKGREQALLRLDRIVFATRELRQGCTLMRLFTPRAFGVNMYVSAWYLFPACREDVQFLKDLEFRSWTLDSLYPRSNGVRTECFIQNAPIRLVGNPKSIETRVGNDWVDLMIAAPHPDWGKDPAGFYESVGDLIVKEEKCLEEDELE